jgi:anti-sigma B factor antagonist
VDLIINSAGAIIGIKGEIDVATVDAVRAAIVNTAQTEDVIVVDLTDVTYVDSSTIGLIVAMSKELSAKRGQLRVVAPAAGRPRRVFELTGVAPDLALHETLADATLDQ